MYNLPVDIRLRRELGAFESIRELGDLLEAFICQLETHQSFR